MSSLSSAQIQQYKNDGYVAPLDVLSKDEAKEVRDEIEFIEKKWPNELEGLGRNYIHLISPTFDKMLICTVINYHNSPGHGPGRVRPGLAWERKERE